MVQALKSKDRYTPQWAGHDWIFFSGNAFFISLHTNFNILTLVFLEIDNPGHLLYSSLTRVQGHPEDVIGDRQTLSPWETVWE